MKNPEQVNEEVKDEKEISRRDFIKGAGLVAGGLAIGSPALIAAAPAPQAAMPAAGAATQAGAVTFEVFDPLGPIEVSALFSPRLDTLEGKTIAYSEGTWMVGTAKPLVLDLLKKQFPTMKVVDIQQYGEIRDMTDAQVAKLVKDKGLDAVIVGNAG